MSVFELGDLSGVSFLVKIALIGGAPLALGLLLLASMLAALGYVTVRGVWSVYLRRAWRARRHRARA